MGISVLVRSGGLEPPRVLAHSDLNAARLPIPPRPHSGRFGPYINGFQGCEEAKGWSGGKNRSNGEPLILVLSFAALCPGAKARERCRYDRVERVPEMLTEGCAQEIGALDLTGYKYGVRSRHQSLD